MSWFSLVIEIDAGGMSGEVAARVANYLPDLPSDALVRLIAGSDAVTGTLTSELRSHGHLIWLDVAAPRLVELQHAVVTVSACCVRGPLDDAGREVLRAAYRRGTVLLCDIPDTALGVEALDATYQLPDTSAAVGATGEWRCPDGHVRPDLQSAIPAAGGPIGRLPKPITLPAAGSFRHTYWFGGTQALAYAHAQCEGFAALGFGEDADALRAWIDEVVPNRQREDVRFSAFPVFGFERPSWAVSVPTTKAQNALLVAAAWMLAGQFDRLLLATGVDDDALPPSTLRMMTEFVVAAMAVAAQSRAPLDVRLRVVAALRLFGHPGAQRALDYLRRVREDLLPALPRNRTGRSRRRAHEWKEHLREHLREALAVGSGAATSGGITCRGRS